MRQWLLELDQLLRGEATSEKQMGDGLLNVSARGLAIIVLLLAMIYGLCMGSFSLLKDVPPELEGSWGPVLQVLASMIKVPGLFFLTLLVTFPSLYVFNALVGSRLRLLNLLRLLIASLAVNVAVLASMGLIVAFFSLSTSSYSFVVLLNVAVFTVSGALGLMFLLQTLHRMTNVFAEQTPSPLEDRPEESEALKSEPIDSASTPAVEMTSMEPEAHTVEESLTDNGPATESPGLAYDSLDEPYESQYRSIAPAAIDMPEGQVFARHTRIVFRCWLVLFSLVGAQMGWVLRPFIGSPGEAFSFFRERESNFFASVFAALFNLLSGGG